MSPTLAGDTSIEVVLAGRSKRSNYRAARLDWPRRNRREHEFTRATDHFDRNEMRRAVEQASIRVCPRPSLVLRVLVFVLAHCAALALAPTPAAADEPESDSPPPERSPWIVLPILSSNPKLGTSVGALGAYVHYFDAESQPSMFGAQAQYTSTQSKTAGVFAKTSFDADTQRLVALVVAGEIKNRYEDFQGSGQPLGTEDNLRAFAGRYLYRVAGDWFVGVQGSHTNYQIVGQTPLDDQMLQFLGLSGFKGGGIGAVVMHDSRDNDNSPSRGWMANINNIGYREAWGAEQNYQVVRVDLRGYWTQGEGNVIAARQFNQLTYDAPPSAQASIQLRGYKFGQYLGKNMSSAEAEYRLRIARRWTATFFGGAACLYGDGLSCGDSKNLYPSAGAGVQFVLREKEGMVANLEYAKAKGDYGIYLKLGYGF